MIILINPKPIYKRVCIYIANTAIELTVEYHNGLKKTERGLNTVGGAKKYFAKHYLCEPENRWSDENQVIIKENKPPKLVKRKIGRPKKRGRPIKKAAKLKSHKHLTN